MSALDSENPHETTFQGRCQRTNPPCKYLHPPQHLKEQLLQNGRNNLIRRNLQLNAAAACFLPTIYPMVSAFSKFLCKLLQGIRHNPYL